MDDAPVMDICKQKKNSPLDILRRRFASGQITTKEYQEMKKVLKEDFK